MQGHDTVSVIVIAVLGGLARSLHEFMQGGQFRIVRLFVHGFTGGYTGYILADAASNALPGWERVAAAVGGVVGIQAIELVYAITKRYLAGQRGVIKSNGEDDEDL